MDGRYFVDDESGNLIDAQTGESSGQRFKHPRETSKYHFATVLEEWRRQEWTPDVVIKEL